MHNCSQDIDPLDTTWYEMREIRRRSLDKSEWIPLRVTQPLIESGTPGRLGYQTEFCVVGTLAVPQVRRAEAEALDYDDFGYLDCHTGWVVGSEYFPSDVYVDSDNRPLGTILVLHQSHAGDETPEWHLHQDIIMTLGLKRDGDVWIRPQEDFTEVVRLRRDETKRPVRIDIRALHLKDYLCARRMSLYATTYRERVSIVDDAAGHPWNQDPPSVTEGRGHWEARIVEIHEGSEPYGWTTAVHHITRTGDEIDEDVPRVSYTDETQSKTWILTNSGKKLYRISGHLWKNEWIEPARSSPRVRGDRLPSPHTFIVDAEGTRETAETLLHAGGWLWFRPEVCLLLANKRGGSLEWYTNNTGLIAVSPSCGVHFGMNSSGLINVFAKDIALLPEWQQRLWSGQNIDPEGGVAEELLASQALGIPSETQAPEALLLPTLEELNQAAQDNLGKAIIRPKADIQKLLARTHRFRATSRHELLALAKDLAILTVETLDLEAIRSFLDPAESQKLRSLGALENLLAQRIGPEAARSRVGPLVGIYKLRNAYAHLASEDLNVAFDLVGISQKKPTVIQAQQMLQACVEALRQITCVIERWDGPR